jgi:putative ABC transport system permease protein
MGCILMTGRLVMRDLRRRPLEAVLVLLAITAATATMTLGFALNGVTARPYAHTRAATDGPDITAVSQNPGPGGRAAVESLADTPEEIGHGGPYPLALPVLKANGKTVTAVAEGRASAPSAIDRPQLIAGTWVSPGGVVIERSFALVLGLGAGDKITLNGTPYRVAGIAVTAAAPQYPETAADFPQAPGNPGPGLIWVTEPDARALATTAQPLSYLVDLKLADPAGAEAFENKYLNDSALYLTSWLDVGRDEARQVQSAQMALLVGSWLLGMLAIASVAVLVGGRMAEQTRRVGLLKAVGGTPALVAAVLLAENLLVALAATAVGLGAGWLAAPLFTSPDMTQCSSGSQAIRCPTNDQRGARCQYGGERVEASTAAQDRRAISEQVLRLLGGKASGGTCRPLARYGRTDRGTRPAGEYPRGSHGP